MANKMQQRPTQQRSQSLLDLMNEIYPFDAFNRRLVPEFPEMPDVAGTQWHPSVDVREDDGEFKIMVDVPGVDPKDIEVNMEDNVLSIKGERESTKHDDSDQYKRVEREWGSFERRFTLPESVDAEQIQARSKNGVLEISVPKTEEKQGRKRIEIKEED